jgi:hypothetical protein
MSVYSGTMAGLERAPTSLVVLAITGIALGAALLVLLGWHVVRRILDVPRVPRGRALYVILVGTCTLCIAAGVTALALAAALGDWQTQIGPSAVAEAHCRRVGPTRVELSFVPLGPDGQRGPEETQTIESLPCELAVERLHFSGALARLGLIERLRLARVGAIRRPTTTPLWRALPQPLGLPIASAEAQQVAIPTEDGASYRVVADDRGVRVEKLAR